MARISEADHPEAISYGMAVCSQCHLWWDRDGMSKGDPVLCQTCHIDKAVEGFWQVFYDTPFGKGLVWSVDVMAKGLARLRL